MKCFAIAVCMSAMCCSLVCGDMIEEARAMVGACAKEHEVDQDTMVALRKDVSAVTVTDNIKCFSKCVLENSNSLKDKELNVDEVEKISSAHGFDEKKIVARVEKCKDLYKGEGTCDEAWDVYKCFTSKE